MRKLKKPNDLPLDVLLTCIKNYNNEDLVKRLSSISQEIVDASDIFEQKVKSKELHTLEPHDGISGIVTTQEMKNIYNDKLAKKGQPGRDIYDRILNAPKHKKCPLCGIGIVTTLDHHLPKAKYPSLAITPVNLIPSCADCNKTKTAVRPYKAEEETIHPYYDDIETDLWLKAEVINQKPLGFKYYVNKPDNWDDLKFKRVKNHFNTFKLGPLYSIFAAEEFSLRELTLNKIFEKSGSLGLKLQLEDYAESSERVHLNSWQSAMFHALEKSDWYTHEYFDVR